MNINAEGLRIIEHFESFQPKAYRDMRGIITIGFGHTGPDVVDGMQITDIEAQELLRKDCRVAEEAVTRCVRVPLTENQFSALVCLCFNIGQTAFQKSTLVQKLNQKQYQAAADSFLDWDHASGKVVGGLLARRRAERDLFLS